MKKGWRSEVEAGTLHAVKAIADDGFLLGMADTYARIREVFRLADRLIREVEISQFTPKHANRDLSTMIRMASASCLEKIHAESIFSDGDNAAEKIKAVIRHIESIKILRSAYRRWEVAVAAPR